MVKNNNDDKKQTSIPAYLLAPIKNFLEGEMVKWKKTQKEIKRDDPFSDGDRDKNNSMESDLDEQIGHFDAEIKIGFVNKQLIQLRKALARIKIGKYGVCEKCGKMIDTDRLAIKPEITTCINCARDQE